MNDKPQTVSTHFPRSEALTTALEALVQQILPALVVVQGQRNRTGAGVIWQPDGLVLTNQHVLGKKKPFVMLNDGRYIEAQVLAKNTDIDLALLRLPVNDLTAIPSGDRLPQVGELVFAFGHPWGQRCTVTSGIISALISAQTRKRKDLTLLRTDVLLAPGNSGGPLVSAAGKMIGINNMIAGGDQSLAISIVTIREFTAAV